MNHITRNNLQLSPCLLDFETCSPKCRENKMDYKWKTVYACKFNMYIFKFPINYCYLRFGKAALLFRMC